MLHGMKPDISHLRVFRAHCFIQIPPELQEKLGPHSHEAVFVGYPPGVKAWHCCDLVTGTFFNSCDVIFDKTFSNCPFPSTDSDNEDDDYPIPTFVGHAPPSTTPIVTPPTVPVNNRSMSMYTSFNSAVL
jgi:hypothetical protein